MGKRRTSWGLGTAQLGMNDGILNQVGKPSETIALEILRQAGTLGLDCLDTASGHVDSEELIGRFNQELVASGESLPQIVSKLPSLQARHIDKSILLQVVRDSVTASLARLHRTAIDVYLLHDPSDLRSFGGRVITALQQVKQEGLVKRIGVSVYTRREAEFALGWGCLDAIQIPINIMDHRFLQGDLLKKLAAEMDVYARSIFLQGLVLMAPEEVPSHLAIAREPLAKFRRLCKELNRTPCDVAISFVRDLEGIHRIIIRCESPAQLQQMMTFAHSPKLSPDVMTRIRCLFRNLQMGTFVTNRIPKET
ncbi:aldo/keto reductase [Marininema halotolerans]|uniref:Predicted oxidoreductase n=1 Tax=Marininema halotolerans TaxID=1155944 RepID=A0A1I6NVB4_9BACL|nr:aldo/keto reductase [Marininema halotolerans]SFS31825.1 Predicted oxidoreductase [Marininema halotolerans]